jgi:hypothetical protein
MVQKQRDKLYVRKSRRLIGEMLRPPYLAVFVPLLMRKLQCVAIELKRKAEGLADLKAETFEVITEALIV